MGAGGGGDAAAVPGGDRAGDQGFGAAQQGADVRGDAAEAERARTRCSGICSAWLLYRAAERGGTIVSVAPTFKPQTINAMDRTRQSLDDNVVTRGKWQLVGGFHLPVSTRRGCSSSRGRHTSKVVGATADLLLSVDEAQDIDPAKFDKEFDPMTASTNATRVFWGTAWTSQTLLARQRRHGGEAGEGGRYQAGVLSDGRGRGEDGAGVWAAPGAGGQGAREAASAGEDAVFQRGDRCAGGDVQCGEDGADVWGSRPAPHGHLAQCARTRCRRGESALRVLDRCGGDGRGGAEDEWRRAWGTRGGIRRR